MWIDYYNKEKNYRSLEDFPEDCYGFVYVVHHKPTGKNYIGKKILYSTRNKKLTKKEIVELEHVRGRKPSKKTVITESNWKTYYGSNTWIKEQLQNGHKDDFSRYILQLAYTKKHLSYLECKYLFKMGVLEKDSYLNDNILGKFYSRDIIHK